LLTISVTCVVSQRSANSSDIRRCRKEFQILLDVDLRSKFLADVNDLITNSKYEVIADGIRKEEFIKKYGKLANVYELCLSFILERTYFCLNVMPWNKTLYIIIEERGKREDNKLKDYILKVISRGTHYVSADNFRSLNIKIEFRKKKQNVNGLQISDLIAYPVATYVLDKNRANPAFDIVEPKFYRKSGIRYGLKTFP